MKKFLITLLQIVVTAGALWFIFKDPSKRASIASAMRHAELGWIVAAVLVSALSPLAAGGRWGMLMSIQGIRIGWKRVAQLYMIGNFFNLFLFGSTGGDAIKMFYLLREAGPARRASAILSVIMDRLIGLLGLVIMGLFFVTARYHWLTGTKEASALLATFVLILGSALCGFIVIFAVIGLRLVDRLPERLPGRAKFIEVATAFQAYARAWPKVLLGVGMSWVGHASFFFTFYFAARAVRSVVSLWDMSTILPIVNTIVALPISVSGVGVRETLFTRLLGDLCGTSASDAVSISIIGFLCSNILFGLLGIFFFLSYRSATGAPPPSADSVESVVTGEAVR